ncbi:MAG: hypothetical protein ACKVWR_14230 [Acidimicrobiales bacterium]
MTRTAEQYQRSGRRLIVFGVFFLALMLGMWWLVEQTNREGEHDAQLLPLFALIPLGIGAYRLIRARARRGRVDDGRLRL